MTLPIDDARLVSALDAKMGLELLELTAERVVGRMPVEGNTQPFGLWHGGASCVLAETLASLGSYAHGQPNRIGVGVDLNATHHRPARPAGSPAPRPPSVWAARSSATRSCCPTTPTGGSARPG